MRRIPRAALLAAAAALAAGCSGPSPLTGAAAARSRGAAVAPAAPGAAEGGAGDLPSRPENPWLDDARDLAKVNGRPITLRQVRHEVGPVYDTLAPEQLHQIVQAKVQEILLRQIVVEEAKRVGIQATDEDLERETEREERNAAARGTTLDQTIRDNGMTRREWDDDLKDRILFQRAYYYFTGQFPSRYYGEETYRPSVDSFVTPGEVRAFGASHAKELGILRPPRATLRLLELRFGSFRGPGASAEEARRACAKAMDAAEARLAAGEPFEALAKEISEGPERDQGGLFGPFDAEASLRQEFKDWAFAPERKDGDVSPRIALNSGLFLLRMESLEAARSRDIEEWGPEARDRLLDLKRTVAWNRVRIALLEQSCIDPADLKSILLARLRGENRKIQQDLPR